MDSRKANIAIEHDLERYDELYGDEERWREMQKHSEDCDCDDCEARREWWRNLEL